MRPHRTAATSGGSARRNGARIRFGRLQAGYGKISDPIKTRQGFDLIYVASRKKHGDTVTIKASRILIKLKPSGETIDALQEKADSLRKLMVDDGFKKAAIDAAKLDPSEVTFDLTGFFPRTSVPGIGFISGLGHFLFAPAGKENENISERLENNDAFYLFSVKQRLPKGTLPLPAVQQRITQILATPCARLRSRLRPHSGRPRYRRPRRCRPEEERFPGRFRHYRYHCPYYLCAGPGR